MNISLKCRCGALRGIVEGVEPSRGMRVVCLCDDCQAYAHFLGREGDVLDRNGGTDIYPVTPSHLKLTRGQENLRCLRLSPKGILRWYAGCCKTPIANSAPSGRMPYNGVVHSIMDHAGDGLTRDQALGPVRARIFGKFGIDPLPPDTSSKMPARIIVRSLRLMLPAWLKREYRPSPFFDGRTGQPSVEPYTLTLAEREALRSRCGPRASA